MKIVLSVVLAIFLLGCSQESKEDVKKSDVKKVQQEKTTQKSTPEVEKVSAPKELVVKEVVALKEKPVVKTAPVKKEVPVKKIVLDAKELYKTCSGCHGQSGEKVALGKSKIIKGWSVKDTTIALNGYKDGSYGGAMKGLMKGQVNKLDAEQIAVLAQYISKL